MFVKKVKEIKKISYSNCWKHCLGNENPAVTLSCDENLNSLKDQELWRFGPPWLRNCENRWPHSNVDIEQKN